MARLILLDSGPLGLIVRAPSKPQVVRCLTRLKAISAAGATVIIPEIAHYYLGIKEPHAGQAFQPDFPDTSGWKA